MSRNPGRPLSPHLTIWKWGPHMLVSILHRATGTALAVAGGIGLVWWLTAAAMGQGAYEGFLAIATSWLGWLVAIGLTWSFFQHQIGRAHV
jgi:succinate dehydrogenase / fumarate reductase cytochrome b subunit